MCEHQAAEIQSLTWTAELECRPASCAPSSVLSPCRPTASGVLSLSLSFLLSLSHTFFSFLSCWVFPAARKLSSCPTACGVSAPWPRIKPTCPALEGRFLTPGPPGKCPHTFLREHGLQAVVLFCFFLLLNPVMRTSSVELSSRVVKLGETTALRPT